MNPAELHAVLASKTRTSPPCDPLTSMVPSWLNGHALQQLARLLGVKSLLLGVQILILRFAVNHRPVIECE
jgi:hypothetical protein